MKSNEALIEDIIHDELILENKSKQFIGWEGVIEALQNSLFHLN